MPFFAVYILATLAPWPVKRRREGVPTKTAVSTVVAASNKHGIWYKDRIRTNEEAVIHIRPACLPASVEQFINPST